MGEFGAPPYCLFLPFIFKRAIRESPLRCVGVTPFVLFSPFVSYGRFVNRPYKKQQDLIVACRGDHILAKQVCHEAKRNIESPATLFACLKQTAKTGGYGIRPLGDFIL